MGSMTNKSIVTIYGYDGHSCGYCHSENDTSFTYGLWAHSLTCQDYQDLINRGWRRSGQYLYKPDLRVSCCPQYTIRLNANEFVPSKSQRKVVSKFNRYIEGTWQPKATGDDSEDVPMNNASQPSSVNYDINKSLPENIHLVENLDRNYLRRLQIVLEPASYTEEKYELFRKYQIHIHKEEPSKVTPRSFERFLVDSPMKIEPFPDGKPGQGYGSFHQKYILDGKLIAVAVLDILPLCVSSVYFMYDPDYGFLGLGKYSALRETSMTQELCLSVSKDLQWYYMGYYIYSCPKMNYKGGYRPSDLLDPVTYEWFPIDQCKKWLDQRKFVIFSDPENQVDNKDRKPDARFMPGSLDMKDITSQDCRAVRVVLNKQATKTAPVTDLLQWGLSYEFQKYVREYIAVVGRELSRRLLLK